MDFKYGQVIKLRWRIVLPALFSVVSVYLMVLTNREAPMLKGMGTGWEVPATVVNALVNGQGFFLGGFIPVPMPGELNRALGYDASRLFPYEAADLMDLKWKE